MAADQDPNERIVVAHPDIEPTSVVTRKQLNEVWAEKGFKEVKGADPDNPSPASDALPQDQEPVSVSSATSSGESEDETTAEESPKRRRRNLNG